MVEVSAGVLVWSAVELLYFLLLLNSALWLTNTNTVNTSLSVSVQQFHILVNISVILFQSCESTV